MLFGIGVIICGFSDEWQTWCLILLLAVFTGLMKGKDIRAWRSQWIKPKDKDDVKGPFLAAWGEFQGATKVLRFPQS
jgi:hypothetical protein